MIQTANLRTIWRHKGPAGSVRMVRLTLPWNAGAVYLVLSKPFRKHRLRVVYCGVSRLSAVAVYAQSKSEASRG